MAGLAAPAPKWFVDVKDTFLRINSQKLFRLEC
jgi:hypothetical protein